MTLRNLQTWLYKQVHVWLNWIVKNNNKEVYWLLSKYSNRNLKIVLYLLSVIPKSVYRCKTLHINWLHSIFFRIHSFYVYSEGCTWFWRFVFHFLEMSSLTIKPVNNNNIPTQMKLNVYILTIILIKFDKRCQFLWQNHLASVNYM